MTLSPGPNNSSVWAEFIKGVEENDSVEAERYRKYIMDIWIFSSIQNATSWTYQKAK